MKLREAYVSSHDMFTIKMPLFNLNYKFIMFVFVANKKLISNNDRIAIVTYV